MFEYCCIFSDIQKNNISVASAQEGLNLDDFAPLCDEVLRAGQSSGRSLTVFLR